MAPEGPVLGIDPGSWRLGWGVLEAAGGRARHLGSGTLRAPPGAPLAERLGALAAALEAVVGRFGPRQAAVEAVFAGHSAKSALVLGQARGAALAVLGRGGVGVVEYAPTAIKQAATGAGHADKAQVGAMMRALVGLSFTPEADAGDALAAAWCHLQSAPGVLAGARAAASRAGRRGRA